MMHHLPAGKIRTFFMYTRVGCTHTFPETERRGGQQPENEHNHRHERRDGEAIKSPQVSESNNPKTSRYPIAASYS